MGQARLQDNWLSKLNRLVYSTIYLLSKWDRLVYLCPFKTTGIGGREGAKERELEWARQNDQAGEDLLD